MSQTIYVEDYTEKSFVVRGETQKYKDSIKGMGGKWNSRLTDKETGDKFGAWLFWADKRKEIDGWVAKGCKASDVESKTPTYSYGNSGGSDRQSDLTIKRLESKIDRLTKMVEQICVIHDIEVEVEVEVVEKTPPKPRRLMQQRPSRNAADDFEIEDGDPVVTTKPRRLLKTRK
jgi:hypothetical protein